MKINKLNIISFGGLKNLTLDFNDGFNCIYGENENGKTTVMSFIKMLFYGSERGSSQISKNIRKKYTPWDGSSMAGSIEFEKNGRKYRLEREFRTSNSTDKVSITDLSLGEKQPAESDIGIKLFGLSAAAFERSLFIGQLGFPESDTAAESEINARLSNMVSTGDEKISLDTVKSRLEKARFALISKSGKTGAYYKNFQTATELKQKLDTSLSAQKRYIESKEKIVRYKKETSVLLQKAEVLKELLSAEQDIKNAEKLRDYVSTKEELESLKLKYTLSDGTVADENYQRNLKFCIAKTDSFDNKIKAKENEAEIVRKQVDAMINAPKLTGDETVESVNRDLELLDSNLSTLNSKIKETEKSISDKKHILENGKNLQKKFNPILLLFGILLLLISPVAALISHVLTVIPAVLGAVLLILSFVIKPIDNKRTELLKQELSALESILQTQNCHSDELKEQITAKKTKLEAIKLSINTNSSVIGAGKLQLKGYEEELASLKTEKELATQELNSVLLKLNIGNDENLEVLLENLGDNVSKQKELKQKIGILLKDLNNISYEDAKLKLAQIESENSDATADFGELKSEYENIVSQITERKVNEAAMLTEFKSIIAGVENPDTLEKELQSLVKLMEEQKAFCDSIDISLEVLADSFAELRQNYGNELEKKSAEIFSSITNGKYTNMTVSKSFAINVEEKENPLSRESDYLSSGTVDQAYLSLRLAVCKLISDGKSLPVFLDDALTQYDDSRTKKALEFLNNYSKDSQMIMFTCHKLISDYSESLGCNVKNL